MKTIKLVHDLLVKVDDEDFEQLSKFKWTVVKSKKKHSNLYYAKRSVYRNKRTESIYMHRELLNAPKDLFVDHLNYDTLDNQRANLRLCTRAENIRNQKPYTGCSSKYRGVTWNKRSEQWQAKISVNNKQVTLGLFDIELEAAHAYDKASIKFHGTFGRPNFPTVF